MDEQDNPPMHEMNGVNMGSGEYKTLQTTTELSSLMHQIMAQLTSLEERLERVEDKVARLAPNMADAPMRSTGAGHAMKTAGLSVSGSATPTAIETADRELLLAPVDEQIVAMIRASGHVSATDVQIKFKYKGKNAASARLNRLYELGLLEKAQAGRVVYYRMRSG